MQSVRRFSAQKTAQLLEMPLRAKILNPSFLSIRLNSTSASEPEVRFNSDKATRTITLNRPKKLNSLNLNMVEEILPRLKEWSKSDSAKIVVLKGAGEKSLCAGGDVAHLAGIIAKEGEEGSRKAAHYFKQEYTLDQLIATYSKPFVALMDGITMGGGVGLSVHAPFRVATEKTLFAMPETTIGFFPDVGGTFMLARLDGYLGRYLGLTSERLKGFDALYAGIATHYVPSDRINSLEARLSELHNSTPDTTADIYQLINEAIGEFSEPIPLDYKFSLSGARRELIDACFQHETVEEILAALEQDASDFAIATREAILKRSPTSVKVSLEAIKRAEAEDINSTFVKEYRLAENFMYHPDFVEGVSALLLTKPSRTPQWQPASFDQLSQSDVAKFFETRANAAEDIVFAGNRTYTDYPHNFGLPREKDVRDYVIGNNSSREYKATREEVIQHFLSAHNDKPGVEHKVNEVLDRMSTPDSSDPRLLDWKY